MAGAFLIRSLMYVETEIVFCNPQLLGFFGAVLGPAIIKQIN